MGATYPAQIRTFDTHVDLQDPVLAAHVNDVQDEIRMVQTTLGEDPQGSFPSVRARFEALDTGKAATGHDHSNRLSVADHDVAARHVFGGALGTAEMPQALVVGSTGAVGDGENPANERHVHPMPTAGTLAGGIIPPGTIWAFAGRTLPSGWLWCDGAVLVRADTTALFNAIGTDYNIGGETAAQFRLPDLRNRFPMGRATVATAPAVAGGSRHAVVVSHGHSASSANTNLDHSHYVDHTHSTGNDGSHEHTQELPWWGPDLGVDVIAVRSHTGPYRAETSGDGPLHTFTRIEYLMLPAGGHTHGTYGMAGRQYTDGLGNWVHGHGVTVNAAGVSATDANLPPFQTVNYMIKT